jgi:hypothetical protein
MANKSAYFELLWWQQLLILHFFDGKQNCPGGSLFWVA